ncbi:MAG TPA: cytochrome D1 domain-containing protein [Gammaproteobacteria bacterium]|nr:cytochrome D1 domain-containing protein [Gammaproteobacteria bacterium]
MSAGAPFVHHAAAAFFAVLWFADSDAAAARTEAEQPAHHAAALYRQHCATCHGADRLGGVGPALLPENLKRLRPKRAAAVIAEGLPATQMPAFGDRLEAGDIDALVELIYTPLAGIPEWDGLQIEASRIVHLEPTDDTRARPAYDADPMNLFLVVESGDHHVTVLDGDRLEPIHRFKSRYALHGGPKFSPDGRYAYLASRDGWVSKFDLYRLETVVETRAGINTRNVAVSGDGRYVMVANYLPHTLVVLSASDLTLERVIPVTDGKGGSSRVSAVYDAPPRQSFIAALRDVEEVWEIQYADKPVYYGRVHDYRVEGPPEVTERFPVRRIELDDYLDDFFFDPRYENLIGAARNANNGQVVSLLVGRKIADIDLTGLPHLGSGITWDYQGRPVVATPNLKKPELTVIEMGAWKVIKRIPTLGPGFFMRSHENSRYAWADVFFGPDRDAVHVIDKATLEIVKTLRPEPGKTAAHVEFTRDGRYALLSIWDMDGAIVVYDAESLQEIKRLPMVKPSGKYNVYNKISGDRGTSH